MLNTTYWRRVIKVGVGIYKVKEKANIDDINGVQHTLGKAQQQGIE